MFVVVISILVVLVIIIVVAAAAWTLRSSGDKQTDKSDKDAQDAQAAQVTQTAPADQDTQAAQEPAKELVWRRFYGVNFVHDDPVAPRKNAPDGRVTFAGDTNSVSQCQEWCEKDPSCLGYTYVGNTGTAWANQCYLVKSYGHGISLQPNHHSGWKYYV